MPQKLTLIRKRYIPAESNILDGDEILLVTPDYLATRWTTLKPRLDIASGISLYCMREGFKCSKVFDKDGALVYWYFDIIEPECCCDGSQITFHDLLVDVLIYPDGKIRLLDLNELADAYDQNLLPAGFYSLALRRTDDLLRLIYSGEIHLYQDRIKTWERS